MYLVKTLGGEIVQWAMQLLIAQMTARDYAQSQNILCALLTIHVFIAAC